MGKQHFKFDFEPEMVHKLLHGNKEWEEWYEAMCEILPLWEIDTANRVAGFIAQCAHESNNFRVMSENLNYSATALNKIFPKYFIRAGRDAEQYHRKPEMIANVIYANRMKNGNTASGDGWKFRGGGILQLTGRYNYTKFGEAVDMSAEDATDYVRTKKGALDSACWFWDTNKINRYCDAQDIVGMTKRINGGTIGLADRKKHYAHALEVLGSHYDGPMEEAAPAKANVTLRRGSKGPAVKKMQAALGIGADGDFGPGTERALKRWQKRNGLTPDGVAGPATLGKLYG